MKQVLTFVLVSACFVLDPANGMRCYDCLLCPTVDSNTPTVSCTGTQTIAGVTMDNKCASVYNYDGPGKGVSRKCAPNVINGCLDIDYAGVKAKVCYCEDDNCNTHVFDTSPTAAPTTTPPGQELKCYNCINCPETNSMTETVTCEGTQVIAGVEMPKKCATFHIYDGPVKGYARQCSANVINGCIDIDYMGYSANACYCNSDRCNGGKPSLTTTEGPPRPRSPIWNNNDVQTTGSNEVTKTNDTKKGSKHESTTLQFTGTNLPNNRSTSRSVRVGNDQADEGDGGDPGNGACNAKETISFFVPLLIIVKMWME